MNACSVVGIGDSAQLPPIEAGSPHSLIARQARSEGQFVELTDVRRMRGALTWLRKTTQVLAGAIRDQNSGAIERSIKEIADRGVLEACDDRDATISMAAAWFLSHYSPGAPDQTLLLTADKTTKRHLDRAVRAGITLGVERYNLSSNNGVREVAVNDVLEFYANHGPFTNGVRGLVTGFEMDRRSGIVVNIRNLDNGVDLSFAAGSYQDWDYGYASTVHKAQGATVSACACVVDRVASAQMFYTMSSRARDALRVFYPATTFKNDEELALHVSQRIDRSDNALMFEALVDGWGGPNSPWAHRIREALSRADDPLRRTHAEEMRAREDLYAEKAAELEIRYRNDPKALRKEARSLRKRYAPETFLHWVARQRHLDGPTEQIQLSSEISM